MNDQSRMDGDSEKLHQQQLDNLTHKVKEYRSKCKQLENELLELQNKRVGDMELQQKFQQEINEHKVKLSTSLPEVDRLNSLVKYYQQKEEAERGKIGST